MSEQKDKASVMLGCCLKILPGMLSVYTVLMASSIHRALVDSVRALELFVLQLSVLLFNFIW